MLGKIWNEGNTHPLLVECKLVDPLWKSIRWLFKELGIYLPQDAVMPTFEHIPKEFYLIKDIFVHPCSLML